MKLYLRTRLVGSFEVFLCNEMTLVSLPHAVPTKELYVLK